MNTDGANRVAVERMIASRPHLVSRRARRGEVVPGLAGRMLLHAGPPIAWERMSGPLRGALIGAVLLEGWAPGSRGGVRAPRRRAECASTPATTTPRSVRWPASWRRRWRSGSSRTGRTAGAFFSTLNEGSGKVLRFGAYSPEVLANACAGSTRRWRRSCAAALERGGRARSRRDARQGARRWATKGTTATRPARSSCFRHLAPALAASDAPAASSPTSASILGANWLAILNPLMAACKAIADAGHGVAGSTIVSTMARNGTDFGIRVSGLGDRWFTGPSQIPRGVLYPGFSEADANPDIGDSVITETAGVGAFAMAAAPAIAQLVGGTPEEAVESTREMYEICLAEHPDCADPAPRLPRHADRHRPARVVEIGILPRINTGIAHREAGVGQIGFGLVRPPMEPFHEALAALPTIA